MNLLSTLKEVREGVVRTTIKRVGPLARIGIVEEHGFDNPKCRKCLDICCEIYGLEPKNVEIGVLKPPRNPVVVNVSDIREIDSFARCLSKCLSRIVTVYDEPTMHIHAWFEPVAVELWVSDDHGLLLLVVPEWNAL